MVRAAQSQAEKVLGTDESALRRGIGPLLGATVVVNVTIGTGIFVMPARTAALTGSLGATLAVWAAGGLLALCGALSLAEPAAAIPRSGGLCEYLRRAYGPTVAFVFGWAELALLVPSAIGSFARLAAQTGAPLLGLSGRAVAPLALAAVAACAGINLIRVRASAGAQAALTGVKYAGVALLAAAGLLLPVHRAPVSTLPAAAGIARHAGWTGCLAALVSVMWAYDGWANLAGVAGEVRAPGRTLPRALLAGTLAVVAAYLLANLGYARGLGLEGMRRSAGGVPAAELLAATLGPRGRVLIELLLVVSCLSACAGALLTDSRVFVPLAAEGLFPRALGRVSARSGVPGRAVVACAFMGGAYVLSHSFEQLADAFVVGFFPFYILAVLAVPVLRAREPDLYRPFRVPLYPLPPALFLLGALALLAGAASDLGRTTLFAFAVVALGVPLRFVLRRLRLVAS